MEFLIHHDGREIGPYSESEVRARLASGAISFSDLAWHEGASDWTPLSSFAQFARPSRQTPPPLPSPSPSRAESTTSLSPQLETPRAAPPNVPPPLSASDPKLFGSYTTATLQADERPLHKTTIHWMVLIVPILASVFSLIIIGPIAMIASWKNQSWVWLLLVIPVAIVASAMLAVKTSELVITDRRVLIKVGFIRRQTFEMFISKIESVAVSQGMLGRFFNYGTVEIRGTGGSSESFATIAAPLQFRDAIQLVQSQSERR
jgi:membrane protein YdbS with pleckstrin-like domain